MQIYLPNKSPLLLSGPHLVTMSDDEFFDFCQQNADLRIERTAHHEILIMSPVGYESSSASGEVYFQLSIWNKKTRAGKVGESSLGYILPDSSTLSPDASWFSLAKWTPLTKEQKRTFLPFCPELVVEVKSFSDWLKASQAKMRDWLGNGVLLGWLLDPETEIAYLYRADQAEPEIVRGFDNELSGEAVLPGFRLRLAELR